MITTVTTVYCTVLFEAIHNWPGCPFDEVAYLRDPHRHIFHIKAYKRVFHDDRDVEFIMLKHEIERYLKTTYSDGVFGAKSCEMLGRELMEKFDLCQVEVSEDNENGAVLHKVGE
ncbi:MAG: hypothetical protein E4H14_17555 [Candidatus Thorarchaeota archaeon]|nr:MAG: hypothetical protein E4H14_17555 [Candidatus Thorarchaeota archaeon]